MSRKGTHNQGGSKKWPWIELQAEWIISDPRAYPTKAKWFTGVHPEVPAKAYGEATVGWTELRDNYRRKVAEKFIAKHRKRAEEYIERQFQMGGAAAVAAFRHLFDKTRDPETGKESMVLKKGVSSKDAVRLFEVGSRIEQSAIMESRKEVGQPDLIIQQNPTSKASGQVVINIPANGFEHYETGE